MAKKLIVLFFILVGSEHFYAQLAEDSVYWGKKYKPDVKYNLKTRDGKNLSGYIVNETQDSLTFENGITKRRFKFKKSDIQYSSYVREVKGEPVTPWGENVHARNYLFSGSAFLMEKGKLSTNSHWLLLENIDYAFTENWGISLNTLAFYPFTLGVKCVYQVGEREYIGANAFVIGDVTSGNGSSLLWGYGALAKFTRGNTNTNFTLSGGVLGLNSSIFTTIPSSPFVNVGFVSAAYCNRFSENVALTLEGWYLPETALGIAGLGFKFIGNDFTCWSLGCYTLLKSYDNTLKINLRTLPIPYIGVSRKFD
jgi:hypothetical protein